MKVNRSHILVKGSSDLVEFWHLSSGPKARTSAVPFWSLTAADRKTNLPDRRRVSSDVALGCSSLCRRTVHRGRFIFVGILWFLFESLPNVAFPHTGRAASIKGEIKTKKKLCVVFSCVFYLRFCNYCFVFFLFDWIRFCE